MAGTGLELKIPSEDYPTRRKEAARWLRKTVGVVVARDLPAEPSEEDFLQGLKSGMILCNLVNKVQPGAIPKIVEAPSAVLKVPDEEALSAYFENIRNFLVAVEDLGLPAFDFDDLEEGGNFPKVVDCLLALKSFSDFKKLGGAGSGSRKFSGSKNSPGGKTFNRKNSEPTTTPLARTHSVGSDKSLDTVDQSGKATEPNKEADSGGLFVIVCDLLEDKDEEDIPIIVENILNKLTEEFESRLVKRIQSIVTTHGLSAIETAVTPSDAIKPSIEDDKELQLQLERDKAAKEQERIKKEEERIKKEKELLAQQEKARKQKEEEERAAKEELERLEKEARERAAREEKERAEREERERIEREAREKAEREERERLEREAREKAEREERERIEREERERAEREERERIEREERERAEREERERIEREERERIEREERERAEREERERIEREERERAEREEQERIRREQEELERLRLQQEEEERLQREEEERIRREIEERERIRREEEEQERIKREQQVEERREKLKKLKEEKERIEWEKAERNRIAKEKKEEKERRRKQREEEKKASKEEQERMKKERKLRRQQEKEQQRLKREQELEEQREMFKKQQEEEELAAKEQERIMKEFEAQAREEHAKREEMKAAKEQERKDIENGILALKEKAIKLEEDKKAAEEEERIFKEKEIQAEEERARRKEEYSKRMDSYNKLHEKTEKTGVIVQQQHTDLQELRNTISSAKTGVQSMQKDYLEEADNLGTHVRNVCQAASGYKKVLEENRKLYNQVQDLKGNIRVYCRVRPFLPGQENNATSVDYIDDDTVTVIVPAKAGGKEGRKASMFTKVFGQSATQEDVFADTQPLIRSVLDGFNVCILAYGQTGSGKTYTLTGPAELTPETVGVNYRALKDLFLISEERKDDMAYEISVNMLEIYNDDVRDLLVTDGTNKIVEIGTQKGVNVPDANLVKVTSTEEVINLMNLSKKNRAVSPTDTDDGGSRSHSFLIVHVIGKDLTTGTKIRGCLHLVDLAGSEKFDDPEDQAAQITKSLTSFGDVMVALALKSKQVNYKNCKLTQLLQEALGAQAKILVFVHVHPDLEEALETVNTLKFIERFSTVEGGAGKSGEVRELKEQIALLKAALTKKESGEGPPQGMKNSPSLQDLQADSPRSVQNGALDEDSMDESETKPKKPAPSAAAAKKPAAAATAAAAKKPAAAAAAAKKKGK